MKQTTTNQSVKNDRTLTVRLTDIKAGNAKAVKQTTVANRGAFVTMEKLVGERQTWEENAYRTSNEQLYAILDKCYRYYWILKGSEGMDLEKKAKQDLQSHIESGGYSFTKASHLLAKIVKCVFASERRITSVYSLVLRVALDEQIEVGGVAEFIRERGGVYEISKRKGDAKAAVDKVAMAKSALADTVITKVGGDSIAKQLNSALVGRDLVIVATQLADGELALKAITYSETAVNMALKAYYAENKDSVTVKQTVSAVASNDEIANLVSQAAAA